MMYVLPIENWDNETLVRLTCEQAVLASKKLPINLINEMREENLQRNVNELLRRLNKE